jgi:hypothetical protein
MQRLSQQTMLEKVLTEINTIVERHKCEMLWPYDHGINRPPVSGKIFVQSKGIVTTVAVIVYKFDMNEVFLDVTGLNYKYPHGRLVYKNTIGYAANEEMHRAFKHINDHLAETFAAPDLTEL